MFPLVKRIRRYIRDFQIKRTLGINYQKTDNIKRIGTAYGGWHLPINLLNSESICYCIGAGEDISFDCGLVEEFNCSVFIFDPTPRAIQHFNELINHVKSRQLMPINYSETEFYSITKERIDKLSFYPYGIWSKNEIIKLYAPKNPQHVSHSILNLQKTDEYFVAECFRLKPMMEKLGHDHIDLLKMDIEGAEYEVIGSIINDNIPIKILCVEFHEGDNPLDDQYIKRIRTSITSLLDYGMQLVYRDKWNLTFSQKAPSG